MKREELEANGEEGTKYKKEPSPCPICGKVSPRAKLRAESLRFVVKDRLFDSGDVSLHRCSPAGAT